MSSQLGTCIACGACCVTYRVLFLRHELDCEPGGCVPTALTESISDCGVSMRCTGDNPKRCLALLGTPGVDVSCAIHDRRPSPCRAFAPDAGAGTGDAARGDARRLHGLPPLPGSYEGFPLA